MENMQKMCPSCEKICQTLLDQQQQEFKKTLNSGRAMYALGRKDAQEELETQKEEVEIKYEEMLDLLRSATSIAARNGKETNWEFWNKKLDEFWIRHKLTNKHENNTNMSKL